MAAALLVLATAHPSSAETLAIVVHEAWAGLDSISMPVLRQLWLGRRTRIAGQRVMCLDLPPGSREHAGFVRDVVGQSERALERYWLRQALTGGPPPPREMGSGQSVLRRVASAVGAIGYVERSALADPLQGVRVLPLVVDGRTLRPDDPDYPIRSADLREEAPRGPVTD